MKKVIQKTLLSLQIVQEVSNDRRYKMGLPRLGKGYSKAHRLNPYNPLSYLFLIIIIPITILLLGVLGTLEELNGVNPFKWQ